MSSRKDPTKIGTDDYGLPRLAYYECKKGYCSEIYDLKCERRCDSKTFRTRDKNSIMFIGERIIMAKCSSRGTVMESRLDDEHRGKVDDYTLMVACTNVTIDAESGHMLSQDCVNGTWFKERDGFNGGFTNYSLLTKVYAEEREIEETRVKGIHYEGDITIYNRTKWVQVATYVEYTYTTSLLYITQSTRMKINIEGCVNTLSMECMAFYHKYGGDGRNYTARAVYECHYDPFNPDFVVINFSPDKTLTLLIFFVTIPMGIMFFSCAYMCICSK